MADVRDPRLSVREPYLLPHLEGCARCHGHGHDDLTFQPLTHPVEYEDEMYGPTIVGTHWAICPTTGEPILLRMVATAGTSR